MSYYEFASDSGTGFGSLEVFYDIKGLTLTGKEVEPGWYWCGRVSPVACRMVTRWDRSNRSETR